MDRMVLAVVFVLALTCCCTNALLLRMNMERTYIMIKPDGVQRKVVGNIIQV